VQWSVMIPVYNSIHYLEQTLNSVLSPDFGEFRHHIRNVETCINRAVGECVHILHGDDYVELDFYKAITQLFIDFPEAGTACTDWRVVDDAGMPVWTNAPVGDERGLLKNWHQRIAISQIPQSRSKHHCGFIQEQKEFFRHRKNDVIQYCSLA
jgi:hypothetical protein